MSKEFEPDHNEELMSSGYDAYHAAIELLPGMIYAARSAANQAVSWREKPFRVGASMFVANYTNANTGMFSGANFKPFQDSPKYCAEMSVIDQAEEAGFEHAVTLVIAGTSNPQKIKEVTGIATPTLHPCSPCQQKMNKTSLIDSDTLIIPVSLEHDYYEIYTFNELKTQYEVDELEDTHLTAPHYPYDAKTWSLRSDYYDELNKHSGNLLHPPALAKMALTSQVRIS